MKEKRRRTAYQTPKALRNISPLTRNRPMSVSSVPRHYVCEKRRISCLFIFNTKDNSTTKNRQGYAVAALYARNNLLRRFKAFNGRSAVVRVAGGVMF
ncbi:hypothetical protein RRG08_054373 [Elysia crispata]|uniref:Uncharacterized protein n=1 Tax=Elysia crispata TaxID=231223 RepID=A0AAE1E9W8_9GAST|nr:hypothetical protein RRG08_054373 [Elysia crispata]